MVTNTLSVNCKVIQKPNNLNNNLIPNSQTNENLKTPLVRFRFVCEANCAKRGRSVKAGNKVSNLLERDSPSSIRIE